MINCVAQWDDSDLSSILRIRVYDTTVSRMEMHQESADYFASRFSYNRCIGLIISNEINTENLHGLGLNDLLQENDLLQDENLNGAFHPEVCQVGL